MADTEMEIDVPKGKAKDNGKARFEVKKVSVEMCLVLIVGHAAANMYLNSGTL